MRKALGSTIFVVVVALIVAGVGYSLNALARLPSTVTGVVTSPGAVTIHEDVFPFNTCTSTASNPNADADFVALHPQFAQCSSSNDNLNWVWYSNPIISAPVNTVVTMEIYNYDSATPILNNYFTQPQGTNSGTITVQIPATTAQKDGSLVQNTTASASASDTSLTTSEAVPVAAANCQTKSTTNCYAVYESLTSPKSTDGSGTYGPGSGSPATTNVPPAFVSHTFTIHGIAGSTSDAQPYLYVSVPISGAYADAASGASAPADAAGMPLAPTITTFSFTTPSRPGSYIWQCFDPCGSSYNGFGGPMSTKGYMSGTFNVTA